MNTLKAMGTNFVFSVMGLAYVIYLFVGLAVLRREEQGNIA
jgi:hypothetical protein